MARRDWYCEDVISGKLDVRRVYEDEHVLAFHHPTPVAEIHVVVVPKRHVPSLLDSTALDGELLSSMVRAVQTTAAEPVRLKLASFVSPKSVNNAVTVPAFIKAVEAASEGTLKIDHYPGGTLGSSPKSQLKLVEEISPSKLDILPSRPMAP